MTQPIPPSAHAHGFDPYASIPSGDVGWFGSKLYKKAKKGIKKAAKGISSVAKLAKAIPGVEQAIHEVSKGIQYTPLGAVGGAALQAMKTGLKGGSLKDIAESAARGAMPDEIEAAVNVASDAVRGRNIVKSVLKNGSKVFAPGSEEAKAFQMATKVLTAGGDLTHLAGARRQLPTEGARRAFDTAVGHAAKVAAAEKTNRPRLAAAPSFIRSVARNAKPKVKFTPLAPRSASFFANAVRTASLASLVGRRETAGLEDNASIYVVENGDNPWAIAKKLMGDGNKWRELVKANPQKPTVKTGANAGGFVTLFAGERLKLPATWTAKHATSLTADAMAQARALLKVWSGSDGLNEAGVTDYGDKPEDTLVTWGSRDRFMLVSFLNWWNRTRNVALPVSGDLVDRSADALRQWAAEHAATANAQATPATAAPVETTQEPVAVSTPSDVPAVAPAVPEVVTVTQSTPSATAPTPAPLPDYSGQLVPADLQAAYDAAKRLTDPNGIRIVAGQFQVQARKATAEGYTAYGARLDAMATDLLNYADKLEAAQMGVPDPNPSAVTTVPLTVTGQAPATPAPVTAAPAAKGDDGMGLLLVGGIAVAKLAGIL